MPIKPRPSTLDSAGSASPTATALHVDMAAALEQRRAAGLQRRRDMQQAGCGRHALIDGRRFLNFSSNDYLGLAGHPRLVTALQEGAAAMGVGSGASHLVCGHSDPHQQLEEALAKATGKSRALLFSNGYMANLAILTALAGRHDTIFQDRLNHASLLDGGLLSRARVQRYRHADVADLERRLSACSSGRKLVVSDGVFSMDGDIAPIDALVRCCRAHDALLVIDDAHGFGVMGAGGGGSCVNKPVDVVMGTLGKALGCYGAFVAADAVIIETLLQFARPYIYTTALPPALAAAAGESLDIIQGEPQRRAQLACLIGHLRAGACAQGLELLPSATAIQPLVVGAADEALCLAEQLRDDGLLVVAIRPPTVPAGSARLRISLSAAHEVGDIDYLLQALNRRWHP